MKATDVVCITFLLIISTTAFSHNPIRSNVATEPPEDNHKHTENEVGI